MVHKMKVNNKDDDSGNFFHNFIHAIKNIFSVPMLGWYISLYTFSGLVLAAISEVATLAFFKYPSMRFVNFGFSISTLNIIATIGTILVLAIPFPYFEKNPWQRSFFSKSPVFLWLLLPYSFNNHSISLEYFYSWVVKPCQN
jgi:hypothetical protein